MGQKKRDVPGYFKYTTSIFASSFQKALYKGSLDISKHHLSGLFLLKRVSANSVRIAFSNELGMSYFDIEITNDKLIIHSCFPSLNRKTLLHLIEKDFRMLLLVNTKIIRIRSCNSKDPELLVFEVKSAKGVFRYTYEKDSGKIQRIQSYRTIIGKTDLIVQSDGGLQPVKVNIYNPIIHLHLHMTLLSN
jgi:hypothetical protein